MFLRSLAPNGYQQMSTICFGCQKIICNRSGVEDTRLEGQRQGHKKSEAMTMDTKKSEAKDRLLEDRPSRGKDQGHNAQEFSKKRSSTKFFRRSQKKGLRKFSATFLASYDEIFD